MKRYSMYGLVFAMLVASPAFAQTLSPMVMGEDGVPLPMVSEGPLAVTYVYGGIGMEEVAYFRDLRGDYTLKLLFSDKTGSLMSDMDVRLLDRSGQTVLELPEVGPYLLVKMPAGAYTAVVSRDGMERRAKVVVTSKGMTYQSLVF